MKVKEQVLLILQSNKGCYISGEQMAEKLYVSRNAVWKAIKALREDGFGIDAVTNKGYMLTGGGNGYTVCTIASRLTGNAADCDIHFSETINSTNTALREMAENGAAEKTVFIANEQTEGRGRRGNTFFSPADSGIYMSILIRPDFSVDKSAYITTAAAVSAVRAIKKATGLNPQIKWVNDIMLDGKKICGILTEGVTDFESGGLRYAVVGLGVNVTMPDGGFPVHLTDIAASLYSKSAVMNDIRCEIAAEILNSFFDIYGKNGMCSCLAEYKSYSCVLGKRIRIVSGNDEYYGTAVDIDENAKLIIKDDKGNLSALSSAEVSIRQESHAAEVK